MTTRTTRQRLRLQIVDPHNLLPEELRTAIAAITGWSVLNEKSRRKPTIAILVTNADEQPSALIHRFYTAVAQVPIVVYDTVPSTSREANAFSAGAGGYTVPGVTLKELIPVIDLAYMGGFGICPKTYQMMLDQLRAPQEFSRRERQVVTLYALGANLQSVADEMQITVKAVEDTLLRACRKAGVDSTVALVTWWIRWTLSDEPPPEDDDEGYEPTPYVVTA